MDNIRNFAIIAHVDHGKSTLADRFLEITGVVEPRKHKEQFLDRNPISRERGITIKLAPVRMQFRIHNSEFIILNLIDTPGHVDFSYEVDRTLSCVEGVILLVDATQGIQAQTISNAHKAIEKNLVIIPAINKIDLETADVVATKKQIVDFLSPLALQATEGQGSFRINYKDVYEVSARTGQGVEELLRAVINKISSPEKARHRDFSSTSPPKGGSPKSLTQNQVSSLSNNLIIKQFNNVIRALIFDSYYDSHRGVISFVKNFGATLRKGQKVRLAASKTVFEVMEVGYFQPDLTPQPAIYPGEIGYLITNLKDIHQVRVGDTIIDEKGDTSPLPGYKKVKPMVFASIFPTDSDDYLDLKKAIERLYLNDSSLEFIPIYSQTLGAGFRVGFLGLLHADVVRERLEREFGLSLILTPPQVDYLSHDRDKDNNKKFSEPYAKVTIIAPQKYTGSLITLCENYRGRFITMDNSSQTTLIYEVPMSEMISGFFDELKSVSSGYASLDWEFLRYESVAADKLTLLINGDPIEEFSQIVVGERAMEKAQSLVKRLREIISRQQYEVKIQAQYKGKIIASERIAPFRKDVTGKLYGGDRTRKDKLLEKQKKGKKRMKMAGKVEIPKEAFLKLFSK